MPGSGCRPPAGRFMATLTLKRRRAGVLAAGLESSSQGHCLANALELKGTGGGFWGGILIRVQIAPLPALLQSRGGDEGDRQSEARARPPCRCAAAGSPRARRGARSLAPRGRARGRLCGAGTMPLTPGCPLCARPRSPPSPRCLCTAPPQPQAERAHGGRWGPARPGASRLSGACQRRSSVPGPAARPPSGPARPGSGPQTLRRAQGRKAPGPPVAAAPA